MQNQIPYYQAINARKLFYQTSISKDYLSDYPKEQVAISRIVSKVEHVKPISQTANKGVLFIEKPKEKTLKQSGRF